MKKAVRLILTAAIVWSCALLPLSPAAQINITNNISVIKRDTSICLNWVSVPGAAFYEIFRDGVGIHTTDVQADKDPFGYTDTVLTPETAYSYEVRALDQNHVTLDTGTAAVSTGKMLAPSITNSIYNVNTGEVTINWANNSDATTGSIIKNHNTGAAIASVQTAASTITFSDPLMKNGPVSYDIFSNDSAQPQHSSGPSQTVTVTPIEPPAISAVSSNGNAVINFEGYNNIGHFRLERSGWDGAQWGEWQAVYASTAGTSLVDDSNAAGTFRYRLSAKAEDGYTGLSNISNNIIKPGAPTNLTCSLTAQNRVTLSWTNHPGNESQLKVLRGTTPGIYSSIATLSPASATYEDNSNFTAGTTYYYEIQAYESESNNKTSQSVSYTHSIPSAPTNLYLIAESPTEISVYWNDNANNELNYKVECAQNTGSFAEVFQSGGPDTVKYSATGLSGGNTYKFRVRASNYAGNSAYSNEVSMLLPAAVAAPNTLKAEPVSSAQVNLSWTFNSTGNYSTQIERKTGAAGTWTAVGTASAGAKSYNDSNLTPNTQYFYRVRTIYSANTYSTTFPANDTGIEVYTKLSSISLYGNATSSNQIYLSWSGAESSTEFTLERKLMGTEFISVKTFTAGETAWYDSGVIPNSIYVYRLKGKNTGNESAYSNEVSVTNTYLDPPSGLAASISTDGTAELTWRDNSSSESGYEVWRYVAGNSGSYQLLDTLGSNSVSYADKSLQSGLQYYYMVRAFTLTNSVYSSYSNAASAGSGILAPPGSLKFITVSDFQVNLGWSDNSNNESGFKIDRKTGANGEWTTIYTLPANTTNCSITSLSPNIRYYFRVKAYSYSYSTDSLSNEIIVMTGKPSVPADIKITALGPGKVRLAWLDETNNARYYTIDRKRVNDSNVSYAGSTQAGVTIFTDTSVGTGTYYYRITAVNDSGSSASDFIAVTTPQAVTFKDITSHWARSAIENLAGRGIIQGSGGYFRPNATMTRAEFVSLMLRTYSLGSANSGSITDVRPDKWYYGELMAAAKYGIISVDSNGRFYPDRSITREDMAVIILKTLKTAGISLNSYSSSILEDFSDKDLISPYALSSMATLCGEKIMEGSGSRLNPKSNATRAEAAVLISKLLER